MRHDRASGAEAVGDTYKGERGAGPEHELLRETGQVQGQHRRSRGEFDRKVAIRHGVERIAAYAIEAELARDALAIDRIARSGERRTAQRQYVDALSAIQKSIGVARQHRLICHQVMAESDRLRDLKVGESRHDRRGVRLREIEQAQTQLGDAGYDVVDGSAHVHTQISRDLVVSRPRRVQTLAGVADDRNEPLFDVEMNVLEILRPREFAARDFIAHRGQSTLDRGEVLCVEHPDRREHACVRERGYDVGVRKPLVEFHRRRIALDEIADGLAEAPRPRLHRFLVGIVLVSRHGLPHPGLFPTIAGRQRLAFG